MLLASTAAACGDSGGSGPGSNIPPATCTDGMIALLGELDGQHVDASAAFTSWIFQQGTRPYTLDLPYDGGMLHLEWNTPLFSGGAPAAASGTLVMPAAAPHAGETICGATGTTKYQDLSAGGSDHSFTLTDLSSGPSCPGSPLMGSLAGCARTPL